MELWIYSISYQKPGASFSLDEQGTNEIKNEIQAARKLILDEDYNQRVLDTRSNVVLSFITRADVDTITYNRIWINKEIGDAFYATNDASIFQKLRDNGWNVTYTVSEFDPSSIPSNAILL